MLKIAVCDDNEIVLKNLCEQIENILDIPHRIFPYKSSDNLLFNAGSDKLDFDIVVTDIRMPGHNGIEAAKLLQESHPYTQFIFVTAYTEYIQDAFQVNPVYYVLKPVDQKHLEDALQKAITAHGEKETQILKFADKGNLYKIPFKEIQYLESDKHTVILHTVNGDVPVTAKLDSIEKKLPEFFIRVHKSYCVNINYIQNISNYQLELINGKTISVAKVRYSKVKENILSYFGDIL